MAVRRMFNDSIINSDIFYFMSLEAQMIYVRMVLNADNRGFLNRTKHYVDVDIMKYQTALAELMDKKFIIKIDDGIYLIKHWYLHNDIPPCWVTSNYEEHLEKLFFDENYAYTTRQTDKPVIETLKSFVREKEKPLKTKKKKK